VAGFTKKDRLRRWSDDLINRIFYRWLRVACQIVRRERDHAAHTIRFIEDARIGTFASKGSSQKP
jgi:hypothetical protein